MEPLASPRGSWWRLAYTVKAMGIPDDGVAKLAWGQRHFVFAAKVIAMSDAAAIEAEDGHHQQQAPNPPTSLRVGLCRCHPWAGGTCKCCTLAIWSCT
mmetsp:Transcript_96360/g.272538  ORF Transcript_96360/g.272538 Transcript_96360/m.272538 type:complete len:98 (+) Transcript_96360:450-743(+)